MQPVNSSVTSLNQNLIHSEKTPHSKKSHKDLVIRGLALAALVVSSALLVKFCSPLVGISFLLSNAFLILILHVKKINEITKIIEKNPPSQKTQVSENSFIDNTFSHTCKSVEITGEDWKNSRPSQHNIKLKSVKITDEDLQSMHTIKTYQPVDGKLGRYELSNIQTFKLTGVEHCYPERYYCTITKNSGDLTADILDKDEYQAFLKHLPKEKIIGITL